jgi:hypothetical protein
MHKDHYENMCVITCSTCFNITAPYSFFRLLITINTYVHICGGQRHQAILHPSSCRTAICLLHALRAHAGEARITNTTSCGFDVTLSSGLKRLMGFGTCGHSTRVSATPAPHRAIPILTLAATKRKEAKTAGYLGLQLIQASQI